MRILVRQRYPRYSRCEKSRMSGFLLGEGLQETASEVAGEKPIGGNKTQTKRPRGVCRLYSEDYLQTIRGRAGSGPFSSIVFSHEAIRCRSHFERGIFRALYCNNRASPIRMSLMWEIRLTMYKALRFVALRVCEISWEVVFFIIHTKATTVETTPPRRRRG